VNKAALREQILLQLQSTLATQTAAAHLARDEAISEESKAESKYDTHGQEATYLAEGQARLAVEIQASIAFYQSFAPVAFRPGEPIAIGALVELKAGGASSWYFIGPKAGGLEISLEGHAVLVLSPQSPLGRHLVGRRAGEILPVTGGKTAAPPQVISVR
jgi:transcription elongation GreA/GreB family factor